MNEEPNESHQARRIAASQVRLLLSHPFFAALMMMARIEITDRVNTAATDGKTLFFNPRFIEGLAAEELDGLMVHEVLHCALLHIPRRRLRDPVMWNIAADIHINGLIRTEKLLKLPAGAIIDTKLEHLSVEEIYAVLLSQMAPRNLVLIDLLDSVDGDSKLHGNDIEAHWKAAIQRATAALGTRGALPANLLRSVRGACDPRLDWRTLLWRWMARTPDDFRGFDRRFVWNRIYLEQLEGETVQVEVCIDTSGSVSGESLNSMVAELRGILGSYPSVRCRLWFADAECYGPFEIESPDRIPTPVGGGGTDFRPFFKRVQQLQKESPNSEIDPLLVYLTDGEGTFPSKAPNAPVLWVVVPGGISNEDFPFGEVVRMV